MAHYCDFGANLNENMRDQFICGICKEVVRQRLFSEEKIDFGKAVLVATSIESAERDALTVEEGAVVSTSGRRGALGSGDRHDLDDVHYLSNATNRMRLSECSACGDSRHRWQECRYKSFECSKCRKRGHLRRMCPESLGSEPVNSGAGGAWKRGRNKRVAAAQRAQARAAGGTVRGFIPGDTVCHQWFLTGQRGSLDGIGRRKRRGNKAFLPRLQKVGCGEYAIVGHRSALE
ncbi:unnamed protein product, partial [Iphiclides podalirius]